MSLPNYNKIYNDLIERKFPEKKEKWAHLLSKEIKNSLELIKINNIIFNHQNKETDFLNQRLRSYDEESIKKILQYQISNRLNNQQTANVFKLSRNTVAKWKRIFAES
ncbi:helix-turn-helix domain-containing protein [Chryseobacterium carnipullorum]|uniref:Helix-turn-helix domain-containing protein n=1 Tax=Chryseobacterium carnipullorum TaxID=1124835 RepID=A0A1M7GDK2_CHRCU|nr:hypothetical protein [Chryseobacterium carnipullorum]AZA46804.1 helix-turn-helix domain-containing protein [Chryseobacterium carnipullorum]AZA66165.1 helix-turn-helix domain-containing protein [Chryseobacterium carnipullorum]SHM14178.1 hypothetical protein SAMN05444360_108111 [Chryseobacterium carnipullorum]STD05970.1 Uncharacterised protein [Chryseobacterium carnipullorum]HBV16054.1 transposase [Chryseobacterium carnipullorum]